MYIQVADYKAWADARGYSYPADAEISAAIAIATDFIDFWYTFKGEALTDSQDLQLPTDEVTIANINKGAAQAVYQQLLGRLVVLPTDVSQKGQVVSESKGLGRLSSDTKYAEGYQYVSTYPTTMIDLALKPYTVGGGFGSVVRG